jgi:Fe-S cluster assembly protein SufD
MIDVMEEKEVHLSNFAQFEKSMPVKGPAWLHQLRNAAIDRFAETGFPTLKDEEWRFTNVAPIAKVPFRIAQSFEVSGRAAQDLDSLTFAGDNCHRLVFVNGRFAPKLSLVGSLPDGVIVSNLAAILDTDANSVKPHLARHADFEKHPFFALNTAFLQDGAFVSIPKGKIVQEPIHLVFLATSGNGPTAIYPRNLILAGINSQATLIESYISFNNDVYFTNAVTEIVAAENAVLDHYKLQRESTEAFHIATMQVHLDKSSNFASHAITLGAAIARNDVNARLDAEGVECTLNGLYLASGRQLIDNHTRIDHAKPHGTSHELYKGILDGKARGVFNGKIYVHPDAQKTDAKQTNKTLLLSEDAVIDTKPQLEIFADDVKCTHGATIGQLADEAIFYLRSRGIGNEEARGLLTFAFANDIIGRIKVEPLRARLEAAFAARPRGLDQLRPEEVL